MLIRKFHILTVSFLIILCFCATTMSAEQKSDEPLTPFQRELNEMSKARQSRDEPRFDWMLLESQRHYELAVDAAEFSNSLSLLYYRAALLKYVSKFGQNKQSMIPLYAKDDSGFNPNVNYHDFVYNFFPEITHNAVEDAENDIIQCMLFVSSQNNDICNYGRFPNLHNIVKTSCNLGRNDLAKNISESAEKRARTFTDKNAVTAGLILAAKCQLNLGNTQKAVKLITETHGIMDNCSAGHPEREYEELVLMFANAGEHDMVMEMCSRIRDSSTHSDQTPILKLVTQFASKKYFDLCIEVLPHIRLNKNRAEAILVILDELEQLSDKAKFHGYLDSLYPIARSLTAYSERSRILSSISIAYYKIGETKRSEEIIFKDLRFSKPDIAETINKNAIYFPISALVEIGHKETAIEIIDGKLKSFFDREYSAKSLESEYFILASCYLRAGAIDKAKSLLDKSVTIFPKGNYYFHSGIPDNTRNAIYTDFGNSEIMIEFLKKRIEDPKYIDSKLISMRLKALIKQDKIDEAYKATCEVEKENMHYQTDDDLRSLIEKLLENHQPGKALEIIKKSDIRYYSTDRNNLHCKIAFEYASLGDYNSAFDIIKEQNKNDRLQSGNLIEILVHYANSSKFNKQNEQQICKKAIAIVLAHKHRKSLKTRENKVDSLLIDGIPSLVSYIQERSERKKGYSGEPRNAVEDMRMRKSKTRLGITLIGSGVTADEYLDDKYKNLMAETNNKDKFDNLLLLAKEYSYHGNKEKAEEVLEKAHDLGLALILKNKLNQSRSFYQLTVAFAEVGCIERAKEIRSLYWIEINDIVLNAAIAKGHIANGNIQNAVDLLTKPGKVPVINTMSLIEPLIERGQYDKAFEMFEIASNAVSYGSRDGLYYPIIRLAESGRFSMALRMLRICGATRGLADVLNEVDRLRIKAGYELSEDDLIGLRMIVHKDIYFCKYPLIIEKENTQ